MVAAEKWYSYQEDYQKYGLDMKPTGQKRIKETVQKEATFSAKDRLRLLVLIVIFGCLFVTFVASTAYAAKIQYDINKTIVANEMIEGEIQNLDVKIKSAINIQSIEEKALKIGMIYPSMSQFIYVDENKEPMRDFAVALKEQAYN